MRLALAFFALASPILVDGFTSPSSRRAVGTRNLSKNDETRLEMNFFKDVLGKAFENDSSLDKDIRKGQYDGPGEEFEDTFAGNNIAGLTETQQKWRQTQQKGGTSSTSTTNALLMISQWKLDLFLTGIPARDPSNDLFGGKTNVSTRDRRVGLTVPQEPTVSGIVLTLKEDGICEIESESEFLDPDKRTGAWKVSDDGSMIRICLDVTGYSRTVQTTGSIEKIYWSNEEGKSTQTRSSYTIPAGPMYGDAKLQSGARVGTLQWMDGLLQVQQSSGLLGAGSKMVPCGKFAVSKIDS